VLEDVKFKDAIIIPRGGIEWGTVTEALPKRRMARGGKLDVNIAMMFGLLMEKRHPFGLSRKQRGAGIQEQ
jgi:hypothetical protein